MLSVVHSMTCDFPLLHFTDINFFQCSVPHPANNLHFDMLLLLLFLALHVFQYLRTVSNQCLFTCTCIFFGIIAFVQSAIWSSLLSWEPSKVRKSKFKCGLEHCNYYAGYWSQADCFILKKSLLSSVTCTVPDICHSSWKYCCFVGYSIYSFRCPHTLKSNDKV